MAIEYKFREDELIQEFKDYIDATYRGHYGHGGFQSSEVIVDRGHGLGFFLGNVDKYNGRYGKKGSADDHRKDLMKILHYALLALYEHDRLNPVVTIKVPDIDWRHAPSKEELGLGPLTVDTISYPSINIESDVKVDITDYPEYDVKFNVDGLKV